MEILLEDIGRRFNQEWIFKKINYQFVQKQSYAILGPNGSGKSTLLQVLAGNLSPSAGKISYTQNKIAIDVADIYREISVAAPYLELIEEFTLLESINFHFKFKKMAKDWNAKSLIELVQLEKSVNKEVRYFSSGMKQRLKLLLACCTDSPILFLDEPTSNLDNEGIDWYLKMMKLFAKDRLTIVCSNQEHEYSFCEHQLTITDYK